MCEAFKDVIWDRPGAWKIKKKSHIFFSYSCSFTASQHTNNYVFPVHGIVSFPTCLILRVFSCDPLSLIRHVVCKPRRLQHSRSQDRKLRNVNSISRVLWPRHNTLKTLLFKENGFTWLMIFSALSWGVWENIQTLQYRHIMFSVTVSILSF